MLLGPSGSTVIAPTMDATTRYRSQRPVPWIAPFKPGEAFGNPKRRVQGRFKYDGTEYRLWVTDPIYEKSYLARSDGQYEVGESYLTVSLGEPHNDACYKLIAAVIRRRERIKS